MAKQSGIHQLRGKVGEHSYYRQTGIVPGLVRSINQGMSARVKTGAEFANTRRNNVEFAGACNIASLLGQMVTPKYRPMILPFSQSTMSKKILEIAKTTDHSWGQRVVGSEQSSQLAEILSAQSKLNFDDIMLISFGNIVDNELEVIAGWNVDQSVTMQGLGISGVVFRAYGYNLATGKYDALSASIRKSFFELTNSEGFEEDVVAGNEVSISNTITYPVFDYDARGWNQHQLLVVVALPYRTINGINYTLQEYCRFKAFSPSFAD